MKKFLVRLITFALIAVSLFSCVKKEVEVKVPEKVGLEPGVYILRNPYSYNSKVINEKGEVLLDVSESDTGDYVTIITDRKTDKPICIMKNNIGEAKVTEYYEYEGETLSYDRPSSRVELYDLMGDRISFDKEGVTYIDFGLGDNIFYQRQDVNKSFAYNIKTGVEKELGGENCMWAKDKVFSSFYTSPDKNLKVEIYDNDLNHIKTIDGYAYDCEIDYKGKECIRISTCSSIDGKYGYNYLDENLNFMFDSPIDDDGYKDKFKDKPDYLSNDEYNDILKKLQEKDPEISFFQKMTYDGITLYIADQSYEDKDTHEWITNERIFDTNFNEKKGDFKSIQRAYDKAGLLLADYDTFYDFNLNLVKKFDRKSQWQEDEKFGKVYLCDNSDENFNTREDFTLYDRDFNVVLENLKRVDISMIPEYIVAEDKDGTKLYDKDFNVVKAYGRSLEIYGWGGDDNDGRHAFLDKTTGLQGIMDKNWDIVIDNLKSATELRPKYFTFQKGFRYGFMDYEANVIVDFPIFDSVNEDRETYVMPSEMFPRVDGSTANMPMMAQIRADYTGESLTDSENMIKVTTTDYAWRNLIEGKNDLLLVYEPSAETKQMIEESGVKLKITPIGVDALVFIENKDNPIDNITTTELQDIYEGKITNWKELGGEDKSIEAFQRPLNSGSQTLFLNLLMKDKTPVDAIKEYRPEGMDDLIEVVASYKNTANALGYSVFYYAKKMYSNPDLKLISVDGVMPTDESIASGEYPFLNEYYLVIREDTPEDSEIMNLYNFILSDKGTEAIKKAGYIPVKR